MTAMRWSAAQRQLSPQQVGSYLAYAGHQIDVAVTAARW
jgi:hypothetical protein